MYRQMAKIYYDPDEDELIPMKKDPQTKPSGEGAAASNKEMEERLERVEAELFRLSREQSRGRNSRDLSDDSGFDDDSCEEKMYDSASERDDTLSRIADAVEENNTLLMRHEASAEARHRQNRDSAITAAGFVVGWKVVDGLTDAVGDAFRSLNPFESSCGCKKKKWF